MLILSLLSHPVKDKKHPTIKPEIVKNARFFAIFTKKNSFLLFFN